jgi:hypothetical protein
MSPLSGELTAFLELDAEKLPLFHSGGTSRQWRLSSSMIGVRSLAFMTSLHSSQ